MALACKSLGRFAFTMKASVLGGLDAARPQLSPVASEPSSFALDQQSGPGPLCRVSGSRDHARGTK
jgi:hypothetical protein